MHLADAFIQSDSGNNNKKYILHIFIYNIKYKNMNI